MGLLKLVVNILSLFAMVSEPVMAAQAKANYNKSFNEFLKLTEVHKRQVTLREFYQKTEKYLPTEIRKQVLALVNEQGDQLMPKIQISKVNYRGKQTPAISFVEGKTSGVVTLLDGYHTGQNNEVFKFGVNIYNVNEFDSLPSLARDLQNNANTSLKKERMPSSVNEVFPDISKVWEKMSQKQRIEFIKSTIQILEASEQLQNEVLKSQNSKIPAKKTSSIYLKAAIKELWAAGAQSQLKQIRSGYSCIAPGGWPGKWVSTKPNSEWKSYTEDLDESTLKCQQQWGNWPAGKRVCAENNIPCNPYIFGVQNGISICVGGSSYTNDTVKKCSEVYKPENLASNARGKNFYAFIESLSEATKENSSICAKYNSSNAKYIETRANNFNKDPQFEICSTLQKRMDGMKSEFCKFDNAKASSAFCQQPAIAPASAAATPVEDGSITTPNTTQPSANPGVTEKSPTTKYRDTSPEVSNDTSKATDDSSQFGEISAAAESQDGSTDAPPRDTAPQPEACDLPPNDASCEAWEKDCLKRNGYMVGYFENDNRGYNNKSRKSIGDICKASGWLDSYPKAEALPQTRCNPINSKRDTRAIQQCRCESDSYNLIFDSRSERYSCVKNSSESSSRDYGSRREKSWFAENKSWLFPMFAILLAGLVGYLAFSSQKKQIQKAADPFFVANPPTSGLIPLPPPRTGTGIRN
jgi:hypothetical protein